MFFKFARDFWQSKTTWATGAGVLTLVGQGITGQMPWHAVGLASLAATLALFHRDTVQKGIEAETSYRATLSDKINAARPAAVDVSEIIAAVSNAHHSTVGATIASVLAHLATLGAGTAVEAPVSPATTPVPTENQPVIPAGASPASGPPTMLQQMVKDAVAEAVKPHVVVGPFDTEPVDGEVDAAK